MGFLRKVGRKIGKGIRKLGRGIKNAFGKLGPIGTLALYYMMPTIAHKFTNGLTSLSKMGNATNSNFLMKTAGKLADATHYAADGIGSVHNGITKAMTTGLDAITGPLDVGSKLSNFINDKRLDYGVDANNQWTKNIQSLADEAGGSGDFAKNKMYTDMLPKTDPVTGKKYTGSTRELAADLAAKEGKTSLLQKIGTAGAQQVVMSTVSAAVNKEFAEDDTGAKGNVFGIQQEEGTGASRTPLTQPMQAMVNNAGSSINTWQQYFNSNLYGTGDPTWQAWHRLGKLGPTLSS
tara:strand:+ start:1177 stop:2052 length:876 start_codon:yes stop_codon:yes gene_type:complete